MNIKSKMGGMVLTSILVALATAPAVADDRDRWFSGSTGVKPVTNQQYLEECGSCHFAYQPGLLPERSWNRMMDNLDNHFGDNAEMEDMSVIRGYLLRNAADNANYKRSVKIMRSLSASETPLRATNTPYLRKKHRKLSYQMVQENPKVGSISNCESCHTQASRGSFSEREILIPGYGRWED